MSTYQMLWNEISRIQQECGIEGTPDMFPIAEAAKLVPDAISLGATYRYGRTGKTCFDGPETGAGYMFQIRTPNGRRTVHVRQDGTYEMEQPSLELRGKLR